MDKDLDLSPATISTEPSDAGLFERYYKAVLAEALALPEEQLVRPTTDAPTATGAIFKKLPALEQLAVKARTLPEFGMREYDQLGPRAYALGYAESRHRMAVTPPPPIDAKIEKLVYGKDLLLAECHLLHVRGCIPSAPVDALKFTTGHRQMALNSRHLIVYLRDHWRDVAPHTTMTEADLRALEAVADEVDVGVAQREEQPRKAAEAAGVRRRMFTLVQRSLDEVERAVWYFHKDEFDQYMPDMHAKKGRRRPGEVEEPALDPAAEPAGAAQANEAPATPIPVGMPGSNPFMR